MGGRREEGEGDKMVEFLGVGRGEIVVSVRRSHFPLNMKKAAISVAVAAVLVYLYASGIVRDPMLPLFTVHGVGVVVVTGDLVLVSQNCLTHTRSNKRAHTIMQVPRPASVVMPRSVL